MKEILISKLLEYIRDNNPDILFALEAVDKLRLWLYSKAESVESIWQQMEVLCKTVCSNRNKQNVKQYYTIVHF